MLIDRMEQLLSTPGLCGIVCDYMDHDDPEDWRTMLNFSPLTLQHVLQPVVEDMDEIFQLVILTGRIDDGDKARLTKCSTVLEETKFTSRVIEDIFHKYRKELSKQDRK